MNLLAPILTVFFAIGALAAETDPPESAPIDVAAKLLSVKDPVGAKKILDTLPQPAEPDAAARFHTLYGLAARGADEPGLAKQHFRQAIIYNDMAGTPEPKLLIALAGAAKEDGDCKMALDAIDAYGEDAYQRPRLVKMRVDCFVEQHRPGAAYGTLHDGAETILTDSILGELEVSFLLERNLRQAAFELARERLPFLFRDDALALVGRFVEHDALKQAHDLALLAGVVFDDDDFEVRRAHILVRQEHSYRAAALLERLGYSDPTHFADAAEVYRRLRRFERALRVNRKIPDLDKQLTQRFGIYLDAGYEARARSLLPRLASRGLLENDEMNYAAAYVHLRLGDVTNARRSAKRVTDHSKRVAITEALDQCERGEAGCF